MSVCSISVSSHVSYVYFPVLLCLSVSVKWLAVKTASQMTYCVSGGALNSTHSLTHVSCVVRCDLFSLLPDLRKTLFNTSLYFGTECRDRLSSARVKSVLFIYDSLRLRWWSSQNLVVSRIQVLRHRWLVLIQVNVVVSLWPRFIVVSLWPVFSVLIQDSPIQHLQRLLPLFLLIAASVCLSVCPSFRPSFHRSIRPCDMLL